MRNFVLSVLMMLKNVFYGRDYCFTQKQRVMYYFDIRHKHERPMCTREWLLELSGTIQLLRNKGRVLLGSTVSGWLGWLSCFVFYWQKTVYGWFGCSTFSTRIKPG